VVNNTRFLLLQSIPNLASKTLGLVLARLSADWQMRYGHPVLLVETFVDPRTFAARSTAPAAGASWGQPTAVAAMRRDFYVRHDQPKRSLSAELVKNARRSLQAEHLRPALAAVEAKNPGAAHQCAPELRSLLEHFKAVPTTGRASGATRSGRS